MLGVISHPDGIVAGIKSDDSRREIDVAPADVEQVIERSQACSSVERLGVYGNAYFARLLECLRAEFEVLAKAAGEEAFDGLCAGYLQACPPGRYTLGQLGARLPQFLEETRPPSADDAAGPDWADFLIDLARLERTYAEVFDGPGEEGTPAFDVESVRTLAPSEWESLRLKTTTSLRMLSLRFPVHEYFSAVRRRESPEMPPPRDVTLAISRKEYIVQRREVTTVQATLLAALQAGEPLGGALERAVAEEGTSAADLVASVQAWFREWTRAGLICGVVD